MAFFYRGIAFPFTKGATSLPAPAVDDALVKQSLAQIIRTAQGERVMRPEFGCNALKFVFENNTDLADEMIRAEVASVVGRFEPRVILRDVLIERSEEESSGVTIVLVYVLTATRQQDSVRIAVA
jgi:phage baseplate assembly protein W